MELREITQNDQERLLEMLTSNQVNPTYMLPDFDRKEDAIPLFQRLCTRSRETGRFVRGIFVENKVVGFLNDVEIENGSIELGYVIHPDSWNKGYATAALKLAIEELFTLGYREVVTGAFSGNKVSLRVMEKAGMQKLEKIDEIDYRGQVHTCLYYHKENNR